MESGNLSVGLSILTLQHAIRWFLTNSSQISKVYFSFPQKIPSEEAGGWVKFCLLSCTSYYGTLSIFGQALVSRTKLAVIILVVRSCHGLIISPQIHMLRL